LRCTTSTSRASCAAAATAFDERHREFRKRARRGIETVLSAMEVLLERRTDDPLIALYRQIDESTLRSALDDCREFERLEDHGLQDELRARYTGLRRYLPAFLELPFRAERGAEPLLAAIEVARELNRDHARNSRTVTEIHEMASWYAGSDDMT